jgi:hypothetical protein
MAANSLLLWTFGRMCVAVRVPGTRVSTWKSPKLASFVDYSSGGLLAAPKDPRLHWPTRLPDPGEDPRLHWLRIIDSEISKRQ